MSSTQFKSKSEALCYPTQTPLPCLRPKRKFPRPEFCFQRRKAAVTPGRSASAPPGVEPSSAASAPGEGESTLQLPGFCGLRRRSPPLAEELDPPTGAQSGAGGGRGRGRVGGGRRAAPLGQSRGERGVRREEREEGAVVAPRALSGPWVSGSAVRPGRDGRPRGRARLWRQVFPGARGGRCCLGGRAGAGGGLGGESAGS